MSNFHYLKVIQGYLKESKVCIIPPEEMELFAYISENICKIINKCNCNIELYHYSGSWKITRKDKEKSPETITLSSKKSKTRTKSRLIEKTKNICMICDETIENGGIILHKTKRQVHILCEDCGNNYILEKLKSIMENIREGRYKDRACFECPGRMLGEHRNMCKHKIRCSELYNQNYIPVFPKIPKCVYGEGCRCVVGSKYNGEYANFGNRICRRVHENESVGSLCRRMTIKSSPPLRKYDVIADMLFKVSYLTETINAHLCIDKECDKIFLDYSTDHIQCPTCDKNWCIKCNHSHKGRNCLEYKIEQESTSDGQYIKLLKENGLAKECPCCGVIISRTEGCNKMWCENCNTTWCWLCGEQNIDYDHYNSITGDGCKGKLWEGTTPVDMDVYMERDVFDI